MSEHSNISPSFARDASNCLREADVQGALQLCLAGTEAFPTYATGFLILGKCYEGIGRTVESLMAYRQAVALLPGNAALTTLVQHAQEKEQLEFRQFREEHRRRLNAQKATAPPQQEELPREESAIAYLAKKLQDVKRIQPKVQADSGDETRNATQPDYRSLNFVTVTMAEIYATQGEYAEALAAYRELIKKHPELSEAYGRRAGEIEQLLAAQLGDRMLKAPPNKNAY
jgi:tetratricopeptide (TPR) repeat protein